MQMITRLAATLALVLSAHPASAQEDCEDWNTGRFFATATARTVTACLEAGADLDARHESAPFTSFSWTDTEGGNTPLHFASGSSWDLAVTAVLLAAGADVNARNQRGATPLHMAAQFRLARYGRSWAPSCPEFDAAPRADKNPFQAPASAHSP